MSLLSSDAERLIRARVGAKLKAAGSLHALWEVFRGEAIPKDIPAFGEVLLRYTFMSGAASMYELIMRAADFPDDTACEIMSGIHEELDKICRESKEAFTQALPHQTKETQT